MTLRRLAIIVLLLAAGGLGGAAIGNARDTERRNANQGGYYDSYGNWHRY